MPMERASSARAVGPVLLRVPQRLEVPSLSSRAATAGVAVPRAAVLVQVPQHLEMPSPSSRVARRDIPLAAARVQLARRAQVPFLRGNGASASCCERALPVVDQLREDLHAADGHSTEEHGRQFHDEVEHARPREHRQHARAEEVHAALLQRRARVVTKGPAREPGAREIGVAGELQDMAERVTFESAEQRRALRLGAPRLRARGQSHVEGAE
ncbi:hypothetical protein T492DRAFT_1095989 [Pavlovales sp. CCMP2436]|nr:hypothetical protein T492DRAFT_1095989 [Pavlovales sp. CCMP2436]